MYQKRSELSPEENKDLSWRGTYMWPMIIFGVLVLISLFIQLISIDLVQDNSVKMQKNQVIDKINRLPESDRAELALVFVGFDDELTLDHSMIFMTFYAWLCEVIGLKHLWFWCLAIFSALVTVRVGSVNVCRQRYAADLPPEEPYRIVTIGAMFVGWLYLLISYWRMQRLIKKERDLQIVAERKEVNKLAQQELKEDLEWQILKPTDPAGEQFAKFVRQENLNNYQRRLKDTRRAITEGEADLQSYGRSIQELQKTLNVKRAELKSLEQSKPQAVTAEKAREDWNTLRQMRGVAKVEVSHAKEGDKLKILVKVRVPYKRVIYDFGDYEITICGGGSICKEVRSGVRKDTTLRAPLYHIGDNNFCFGARGDSIRQYLRDNQILEAVTVMIDSMHSTNDRDAAYIPYCFRKVKTVREEKNRIQQNNDKHHKKRMRRNRRKR